MQFTIAGGLHKDIVVGSQITINTDYTPRDFNGTSRFTVSKIESGYPFVVITRQEKSIDDNGVVHETITEESAISPELITGVY